MSSEKITKEKNDCGEKPQEKNIIPYLIIATILPPLIHPPFALVIGYIVKKRWIINYIFPYIKPFISQSNVPFAVLGALVAFMWILMTAWTILSRIALGTYDIKNPRLSQRSVTGLSERLQSSYENTIEQFPAFAVGVIIAHINKVPINIRISLSVLYLLTRTIWFVGYLSNIPRIRAIGFILANWAMFYLYLFSIITNFDHYFNFVFDKISQLI